MHRTCACSPRNSDIFSWPGFAILAVPLRIDAAPFSTSSARPQAPTYASTQSLPSSDQRNQFNAPQYGSTPIGLLDLRHHLFQTQTLAEF